MNVYVCTDHDGHWPVGVCSVVVADNEDDARALLTAELPHHGLDAGKPFTLRLLNTGEAARLRHPRWGLLTGRVRRKN